MTDALLWFRVVLYASEALLLLVGLLGLVQYRRLPAGLRYLVGLAWFGLAIELAARVVQAQNLPNLWLIPLDAAGELWLLSLVYEWALGSPGFARWRPWVAGGFVGYAGLSGALFVEPDRFKTGVLMLESLLVLGLVGLYFRKLLNELRVPRLASDAMFWVSSGLLLYALGRLLIALFGNYMLLHYSEQLSLSVWTIHGLLTVLLYGCYGRALWLGGRQ